MVSYHNCRNWLKTVLTCIRSVYCHHNLPKSTLFSSLVAFWPLSSHRMPVDRLDTLLKYCGQHLQKQQRWQMQLPLRLYCKCKDEYWSRFGAITQYNKFENNNGVNRLNYLRIERIGPNTVESSTVEQFQR